MVSNFMALSICPCHHLTPFLQHSCLCESQLQGPQEPCQCVNSVTSSRVKTETRNAIQCAKRIHDSHMYVGQLHAIRMSFRAVTIA